MQSFAAVAAQKNYTVYTVDLPLHGESRWQGSRFDTHDMAELVQHIREKEPQLQHFDLAGYSLGGRVVLASLNYFPQKPLTLYLFAPAAAPQNKFHPYIKTPLFFKKMIEKLSKNPSWLLKTGRILQQIGLVSPFQLAFAEKYFTDEELRKKMFFWWRTLQYLPIKPNVIQDIFVFNRMKVHLLFGEKDTTIPLHSSNWFQKNFKISTIQSVPDGHRGVLKAAAEWLENL
ncbi:MAG: hypothetical protein RI894_1382 [Bacteroidota bacterium]